MNHRVLPARLVAIFAILLIPILARTSTASERETDDPKVTIEAAAPVAETKAEGKKAEIATQWGIEITSIRLSANDHMIDYRYRVLDADKAADLFKRQIKPQLIHQETGKVLAVPETAKLGPLRNSNIPQEGKIYWMFFGNGEKLVKSGDKITVVIGDFRVEDLVVN